MAVRNAPVRESRPRRRATLVAAAGALFVWLALVTCGENADPTAPTPAAETAGDLAAPAAETSADLAAPLAETSGDLTAPFADPAGPLSATAPQPDLLDFLIKRVLFFLEPPDLTDPRSAGKLIKASKGGFVELNGFRVDIPAGALAEDTFITIDLPLTLPAALYVVADFGPDGLTFLKPVRITMPLEGVDLEGVDLNKVRIWFWDGLKWVDPAGNATETSVKRKTNHFSTYGARKGIDTTSGG